MIVEDQLHFRPDRAGRLKVLVHGGQGLLNPGHLLGRLQGRVHRRFLRLAGHVQPGDQRTL